MGSWQCSKDSTGDSQFRNPDQADQVARTVVSAGDTRGIFRRKEQATPQFGRATLHSDVERVRVSEHTTLVC